MELTALFDELITAPRPIRSLALQLLGFAEVERLYRTLRTSERPITERLLEQLAVTYRLSDRDLKQVPGTGDTKANYFVATAGLLLGID